MLLGGIGAVAWCITTAVRQAVDRAEARRNCNHQLVTDPCFGWNATLRCAKGCGHQEPDREYVARYQERRELRIHAEAARIHECPKCGAGR